MAEYPSDHSLAFGEKGDRTVPLHQLARTASVTQSMLAAHLDPYDVVSSPRTSRAAYRWAVDVTDAAVAQDSCFGEDLVFMGPSQAVTHFVQAHRVAPGSLFVVIIGEDETATGLPPRSFIIRSDRDYAQYVKRIQGLFLATWLWETEMSHVVYGGGKGERGKLQRLLNIEYPLAAEFTCVTDTGFNLISCSQEIEPPGDAYRFLKEEGCYRRDEIERLRRDVLPRVGPRNAIVVCEPDERCPLFTLHLPLFIDGVYLFHLTMACRDSRFLPAYRDAFSILGTYVTTVCTDFWNSHLETESACHKILIKLIEGKGVSREYANTQLDMTVIPRTEYFRLARYQINPSSSYERNREALAAAKELLPGHCYPFMYRDDLLVLLCSPTNNHAGVSLRRVLQRTTGTLFEPFGLVCAVSQPFRHIESIDAAYRQTLVAMSYEGPLREAYPKGYDGAGRFPLIPFEHTLQFPLVDGTLEQDMRRFAFARTLIDQIAEDDARQGSDLVRLLWAYLLAECNASEVAKRLSMHRNTVVYHINKFERRFDISLDAPMERHRLHLDFLDFFNRRK